MATRNTRRPVAAAAAPSDTRARILALAWAQITAQGAGALSLVDIARQAGLSRQTLYLQFGTRAGLLIAMLDEQDARSGVLPRLVHARESMSLPQAFEPYVRTWFEYLPQVLPVARALLAAAAAGDDDARVAWDSRMTLLRNGLMQMTRWLQQHGALGPSWTPAAAADWLLVQTHPDVWQHLVVESGWRPDRAVDRIVASLRQTLLVGG